MNDLNARQREMLESALARKRESAEKAGIREQENTKPKVTPEEYKRRLNEMMKADNSVASQLKKERVDKSMSEWSNKVGPLFGNATIEIPRIRKMVMEKVDRIENNGPLHRNSLVLSGTLGVGKTWTAYAYAKELIARGLLIPSSIVHGTETGLLTPLAIAGYERSEKTREFLNHNNKFYIIDEVGRATWRSPEIRHEMWYELINHAYTNQIPIVMTTNKSTAPIRQSTNSNHITNELEVWIGEAAYDRLKNMADIAIPSDENKRPEVGRMMDEGKTLGLQEDDDDPFGGLSYPSVSKTSNAKPRVSQTPRPASQLRPKRRDMP